MNVITQNIKEGLDIGNKHYIHHFGGFVIKILIYLIPGILLGYYIDKWINKLDKKLTITQSVLLQTIINIILFYILLTLSEKYVSEFQITIGGIFFITFYFEMQNNYFQHLRILFNNNI